MFNVHLPSFEVDEAEVTNGEFSEFVSRTGYKTEAEHFGSSFVFKGQLSSRLFEEHHSVVLAAPWWVNIPGASWKHPEGINSTIKDKLHHPVVHVSWNDAAEYCKFKNKRLPTESEWEVACQGGKRKRLFPWGNKLLPKNQHMTNIWQGEFPEINTGDDGFLFTSPVKTYPANSYGLYDMTGNVWEWVEDWWSIERALDEETDVKYKKERVKKGGSFLCHKNSCYRYRCAARAHATPDSSASNLGFRCAKTTN
ncbi:formylglycine-generating enzyme-like isoform X2 [Artemia franciscana]